MALFRLDVLDMPVPDADPLDLDAALSLANILGTGSVERWRDRFVPYIATATDPFTCAAEPWAHIGAEGLTVARRAYADWLADLRDWPAPVPCPTGGCAWCGLGSVIARRADGLVWFARGAGNLCPTCEAVRAEGHSTSAGPQISVWQAMDPDRSIRRRYPERPDLEGVERWDAYPRTANAEPWAHLDLAGLRTALLPSPRSERPLLVNVTADPDW